MRLFDLIMSLFCIFMGIASIVAKESIRSQEEVGIMNSILSEYQTLIGIFLIIAGAFWFYYGFLKNNKV